MFVKKGSGCLICYYLCQKKGAGVFVTYSKKGSNIPFLLETVLSQASAISIKILDSVSGFSWMTPSHTDKPNLIDSLVKIWNGIPTRK